MRTLASLALIASFAFAVGCGGEKVLSPIELEVKNRSECEVIAVRQTGYDPSTSEEPARTLAETQAIGGEVLGAGAPEKPAEKGAEKPAAAANAGDTGSGALIGGLRRRQETQKMVTLARDNPEYGVWVASRKAYRAAFDTCMASRQPLPAAK
jgi:hypothetical protein